MNTQKSVVSLYTNNEQSKNEIKQTIPFTIALKRIKYSNLTKEMKGLYIEDYKHFWKKWKDTLYSWIEKINS